MVCQSGLAGEKALRWTEEPTPQHLRQVESLLRQAHTDALRTLTAWRSPFDKLVAALIEKQQVGVDEITALVSAAKIKTPVAKLKSSARKK